MPGNPDIVLPKYKTVIFVHGCFWHRHSGCRYTYTPKSRIEFWELKFQKNINNDQGNIRALRELGWHVKVIWECETKDTKKLSEVIVAYLKVDLKKE
jgi:DNA mismatch endonuclease (patch repair protein)